MIEMPLYPNELIGGTILAYSHTDPEELKVKLLDGRIAKVIVKDGEFEATYLGDYE
jgi:hypothetical protein